MAMCGCYLVVFKAFLLIFSANCEYFIMADR